MGYQAAGTRGRLLRDGIPEIKMHGRYYPVKCLIVQMDSLSAHADQREMLDWLGEFKKAPKITFLVHGEPQSSDVLRLKIQDELGWECLVPKFGEIHDLA